MPRRIPVLMTALLMVAGCVSRPMPAPGQDADLGHAASQPFRDLSLIREVAPDPLLRAAEAPYSLADIRDCDSAAKALMALDAVLGPDISANAKTGAPQIQGLAAGLVSGAVGLPFRGVVRVVTGAEARDRALRTAVLAGMVRRGFIKGRMGLSGCDPPAAPRSSGGS